MKKAILLLLAVVVFVCSACGMSPEQALAAFDWQPVAKAQKCREMAHEAYAYVTQYTKVWKRDAIVFIQDTTELGMSNFCTAVSRHGYTEDSAVGWKIEVIYMYRVEGRPGQYIYLLPAD